VRIDDSLCEPNAFSAIRFAAGRKATCGPKNDDPRRYLAVGRATVGAIISCDRGGYIATDSGVM